MSQYNRKYDGPPVREIRQVDQEPLKVPPHKKPRTYVLTTIETTVTIRKRVERFVSKAAREQARKAHERKKVERSRWSNWERGNESSKQDRTVEYIETDEIAN